MDRLNLIGWLIDGQIEFDWMVYWICLLRWLNWLMDILNLINGHIEFNNGQIEFDWGNWSWLMYRLKDWLSIWLMDRLNLIFGQIWFDWSWLG